MALQARNQLVVCCKRRTYLILVCLVVFMCTLPVTAAELRVYSYTCSGAHSQALDCATLKTESTWDLQEADCPPISPRRAIRSALGAAQALDFGPSGAEFSQPSITLVECGRGWVYLVRFSVQFQCRDSEEQGETQEKPLTILVLMDGTALVAENGADSLSHGP